ncbi:hypothetical protein GUITHDRAFT_161007 [Guillardia theta CCMP2712]|uniref:Nuclear migration protein nudC n=1 Tax=Guillardia theta (strain CCMP2712) TaxID=905079 RepID=L1JXN1_GUITC|nr:hypothetical protein GUITHDRAFT_161007 [Guillardia theta CCMP2712]EKX53311.1 hypothetical protein GUITHDRAFT_161007 [Guillardia theta CCMP2712]|eukprot:XP_005840291.1 hypothetical protein GUITHDRAFT_161007 [Guillardia theta CCMP2712]
MEEEMDALLVNVAQRSGGIEPMLHSIFSFLKRRTDFYHIQKPGDKIGFPAGVAKRMVLQAFKHFEDDTELCSPNKEELESRGERIQNNPTSGSLSAARSEAKTTPKPTTATTPKTSDMPKVEETNDTKSSFVCYNGGECERYKWSQTLDEIVLYVDCSKSGGKLKAKELDCKFGKKNVSISLRQGNSLPILDGELFEEVKHEDVVWHLEESRFLTINLEKKKKTWWKCALVGDREIDTQRVDSTCKIDDYDEPTQAAIQKLMFDQQQKMQGLPTSDELKQQEILKKAWNAEGLGVGMGDERDPSS